MEKVEIIELWLDAEEENRKHTKEGVTKCLELKDKFREEFNALNKKDREYVKDYIESVGG